MELWCSGFIVLYVKGTAFTGLQYCRVSLNALLNCVECQLNIVAQIYSNQTNYINVCLTWQITLFILLGWAPQFVPEQCFCSFLKEFIIKDRILQLNRHMK